MTFKSIEISFAADVPADPYTEALSALCRVAGPCFTSIDRDDGRMLLFTGVFDSPVELPDGLDRALADVADMACNAYQQENPTRVMWPSGFGCKPQYSKADAAFLGVTVAPDAPDAGEPTFDADVFCIECAEREDLYGENPLNPDRDQLRAAIAERTAAAQRKMSRPA